ncbi:MAG: transposase [Erysipelotrichaceae bacterium]
MIYVGIDIAKHNHYCAITTDYGEVLYSPFLVKNDLASFKELESILSQFEKTEILIGFESTAHYANNLSSYFSSRDFNCGIINPYRTAQLRKVLNPDTKNDKVDSLLICQALQMKLHTLV